MTRWIWVVCGVVLAIASLTPAVLAQWPAFPSADAPRNPDKTVNLKAAVPRMPDGKPDLSGVWETVRTGSGQVVLGAELGVQLARVHHVVPVGAAGPGLQDRRGVDVCDPERVEVRHQPKRVPQGELLAELEPVRGPGDAAAPGGGSYGLSDGCP